MWRKHSKCVPEWVGERSLWVLSGEAMIRFSRAGLCDLGQVASPL